MADQAHSLCQPGPKSLLLFLSLILHLGSGFSLGVFWRSAPHYLAKEENRRPTESSKGDGGPQEGEDLPKLLKQKPLVCRHHCA